MTDKPKINLDRSLLYAIIGLNGLIIVMYLLFDVSWAPFRNFAQEKAGDIITPSLMSQLQIYFSFAILVVYLCHRTGKRWITALPIIFIGSFLFEWFGETYGIPYGSYQYTEEMGFAPLNAIPLVIPIAWFTMTVPAYRIAGIPKQSGFLFRIIIASALVVTWDLVLDPAMSIIHNYWQWAHGGVYYGVPLLNFFGWFLTAFVLLSIVEAAGEKRWAGELDRRWMTFYYGANASLPLAMVLAESFFLAAILFLALFCSLLAISCARIKNNKIDSISVNTSQKDV